MSTVVGIATASELKVSAVIGAFQAVFQTTIVTKAEKVPSDINEQPVGYPETILGATNRLNHLKERVPTDAVDFYVSIENGIVPLPGL